MVARRSTRSLIVAAAALAVTVLAGCSLIPGLDSSEAPAPPPPAPVAKATTGTAQPTATPASGKTLSSVPATGVVPAQPKTPEPDVDGIQARELVADGAKLIDVRDRAPFRKEHIKGATSVPMWQFTSEAKGWDRNRKIVVCDQTGAEARAAQKWLAKHGFTQTYYLVGGLDKWDGSVTGSDARAVPLKKPEVYYFYLDDETLARLTQFLGNELQTAYSAVHGQTDEYLAGLEDEFPDGFVVHKYDLSTDRGAERFNDFGLHYIPSLLLVDENGEVWHTGKEIDTVKLRADLQRAVIAYEDAQK